MEERTAAYAASLQGSDAERYLIEDRGLNPRALEYFRLGFVANPFPGDSGYAGRICIPYLTESGVTSLRFRAVGDGQGPKYLSLPGEVPRIYGPEALSYDYPYIAVCEGEIDTITARMAGVSAVGLPGANTWQPFMARAFKGYATVYVLADDDKAGWDLGERLARQVANVSIIAMDGGDVNSFVREHGAEALRQKIGLET
ncbi:hypothetical protein Lfu02_17490 [Longispora fulva]|uniref:DNA primase n=1 Tax=Longispora fulva TaxID=619741 RepID=A0A8J7GNI2_9ACTN|nr:toprim domain-containing protein [Longispora fulva]MBG6140243.1 DNA primase [Longispora fulva]GIG57377.1 hypothetical protein Lfu02_17490 [Longispora fulva]